jgi:hypothetical protein
MRSAGAAVHVWEGYCWWYSLSSMDGVGWWMVDQRANNGIVVVRHWVLLWGASSHIKNDVDLNLLTIPSMYSVYRKEKTCRQRRGWWQEEDITKTKRIYLPDSLW